MPLFNRYSNGKCVCCHHPEALKINREIAEGILYKAISQEYGMDPSAVSRHVKNCIPRLLLSAQTTRDAKSGSMIEDAIAKGITLNFTRIGKLMDACDAWLFDPDSEGAYTLEPRAREIKVVYDDYNDVDGKGKPKRKRANLQDLLRRVDDAGYTAVFTETKAADPRELILKSSAEIRSNFDFIAKLNGLYAPERLIVIDQERRKQWVAKKIDEVMANFGVDEKGARSWLRDEFPDIPEFMAYVM